MHINLLVPKYTVYTDKNSLEEFMTKITADFSNTINDIIRGYTHTLSDKQKSIQLWTRPPKVIITDGVMPQYCPLGLAHDNEFVEKYKKKKTTPEQYISNSISKKNDVPNFDEIIIPSFHEQGLSIKIFDWVNKMLCGENTLCKKEHRKELTTREFFALMFNWFIPFHELGHAVNRRISPDIYITDYWLDELDATKIAIAYLRSSPESLKLLATVKGYAQNLQNNFFMKLLNPIPKKEHNNKAEFFNENYWKIIFGPGYAYMQMHFITTAMEEYENNPNPPTFEELIVERLR